MTRTRKQAPLASLLVLALSACSGGSSGSAGGPGALDESPAPPAFTAQGACDTVTGHGSCMAYSGMTPSGLAVNQSSCATTGGTLAAACPAAGLVGTCAIPSPVGLGRLHLHAPWTSSSGPMTCGNGAWSAPSPPEETASPATVSGEDPWEKVCADTSGAITPTLLLAVQRYCTGNDRTLLASPCLRTGRSGTCTTAPGELTWRTRHYDAANTPADQQQCTTLGGLWTAG